MARDEARIFATIWDDDDFLAHSAEAQRLYLFLLSQRDLSYCGVIALRERRWSTRAANLTVAGIQRDLAELSRDPSDKGSANPSLNPSANPSAKGSGNPSGNPFGNPLLIVDEDTEEVFVRSLIRHDRIWKIPNLLKAAREAAKLIQSARIRAALLAELLRIPLETSESPHVRRVLADFVADLGGELLPSAPTPSANPSAKGSAKGSGNPSAKGLQGKGERGKGKSFPSSGTSGSLKDTSQAKPCDPPKPPRDDVERLCAHLVERIKGNGSRNPTITKEWRDAARLLIDRDGRTEEQVHKAIDWCQDDEFWRSNILSMPKLRNKYDQLRLQAKRPAAGAAGSPRGLPRSTTDERVAAAQALKERRRNANQLKIIPGAIA